jgi:hypothetical protein
MVFQNVLFAPVEIKTVKKNNKPIAINNLLFIVFIIHLFTLLLKNEILTHKKSG